MKKLILLLSLVFVILITIVVYAKMTPTANEHSYDVEVLIEEGWNLILFPTLEDIEEDSEIQIENIKAGFFYFPDIKSYAEFHPDRTEFEESYLRVGTRNPIEAEELGLSPAWVYSDKKGYLKYWRYDVPEYHQIGLSKGWNLFTLAPEIIGKSIDEIKGDCVIEKAYNWEPLSQDWRHIKSITNKYREEQSFFVGYGLVIKVADDCRLGEEIIPETPVPGIPAFPTNGDTNGEVVDCGTNGNCFNEYIRLCKPARVILDAINLLVEGLEGNTCIFRGEDNEGRDMNCKILDYVSAEFKNPGDLVPYCEGLLADHIKTAAGG